MRTLLYTFKQSFIQFKRNLNMSLISIFAITCMLLILGLACILLINVNMAAETIKGDYDSIEVFLKDETKVQQADEMIADIKQQTGVSDAYYKSKEQAMEEFKTRWGDNSYLLDSLKENPLPNSIVVMIADLEQADDLAAYVGKMDGVEDVKYYKNTVDKLLDLTQLIRIVAVAIMVFLFIVCIIVVSNTIKLTVFNRAEEISIMKYIGATNWFIRGPFFGEGILIGIISAAISLGIIGVLYDRTVNILGDQLYSMLSMPMVSVEFVVTNFAWMFLALGVFVGACGSLISMRKFLDA